MTTPEDTELLERLDWLPCNCRPSRKPTSIEALNASQHEDDCSYRTGRNAAARIRRLQGEVEAVKKHRDDFKRGAVQLQEDKQALQSQLSEAKELLRVIRKNMYEASAKLPEPMCGAFGDVIDAIDAHLSRTKPTPQPETEEADV